MRNEKFHYGVDLVVALHKNLNLNTLEAHVLRWWGRVRGPKKAQPGILILLSLVDGLRFSRSGVFV